MNLQIMKRLESLLLLTFGILLNSCCTLKDCNMEFSPEIFVKFKGYSTNDLQKLTVLLINDKSSAIEDSVLYTNQNYVRIENWMLNFKKIEIKDYSFILKTNFLIDTIKDISFEIYSKKINCNKCFPFGDGSATVTNYKNFSFVFKDIKYTDQDTLIIEK